MNCKSLVFPSDVGWIGVQHRDYVLTRTSFGHKNQSTALKAVNGEKQIRLSDREKRWVELFQAFASGQNVSLNSLAIEESWMTSFQKQVIRACRQIPRGETLTYGQLARIAGSPAASRAVGTVMAKNRFPLVVPCHRVVSSSGLGGFSAPNGLKLKVKLLELEGALEPC